ncbi:hypothetical protein GCM10023187_39170 [Nibrella viscosa]|uniref:histidine kinase n=1 Tax=Nibrella viscosa TaxID=1084524 RepID=A0ABP8KQP5_9BACT
METSSQLANLEETNASLNKSLQLANNEINLLQQKVVYLDQLAGVGQLTAGILHEIKNPLNFINNFSKLSIELIGEIKEVSAKLRAASDPADIDDLEDLLSMLEGNVTRIHDNGGRAERIIQGMLAQTRSDNVRLAPANLNLLLEEFTKLAYQGVRGEDKEFNVSFSFQFDPNVGSPNIAADAFSRVILNLVNNACYAVNEKRKKQPDYSPQILVSTQKTDDTVKIKIRDNGIGMADEVKQRLFTPFFTTKPPGKGTGLGLSLSQNIVTNIHKGQINVDSEPGNYTEFCIELPLNLPAT